MGDVETIKFDNGMVGHINYDPEPMNPRKEYDNLCLMLCNHRRYDLGDEQVEDHDEAMRLIGEFEGATIVCSTCKDEVEYDGYGEWFHKNEMEVWEQGDPYLESMCGGKSIRPEARGAVVMPLFLYDHSGITMSVGAFSCSWDSGQVGIAAIAYENIRREWQGIAEDEIEAKGEEVITAEVKEYDTYLTGMVYEASLEDADGDTLWSCCGFYDEDEAMSELKAEAAYFEGKQ